MRTPTTDWNVMKTDPDYQLGWVQGALAVLAFAAGIQLANQQKIIKKLEAIQNK